MSQIKLTIKNLNIKSVDGKPGGETVEVNIDNVEIKGDEDTIIEGLAEALQDARTGMQ